MKKELLICSLAIAITSPPIFAADNDTPPFVKPQIKTIAAFKNGLGFVYRSGKADLKGGWTALEELPAASLGMLWIGTTNPAARVEEVVSYKNKIEKEADALNIGQLLSANIGKPVTIICTNLGTANTGPAVIKGTILSVPEDRQLDSSMSARGYSYTEVQNQIVLIKSENGEIMAINKADVRSVQFPSDAILKTKTSREVSSAKIRVGGNQKSAEVTLAYMEKGINWSPSYMINIKDSKMADITLEAVLANDVEDIENADVSFVVGYPNFLYSDIFSPLIVQQSVASFMQALRDGRSSSNSNGGYGFSGNMSQSIAYNNVFAYDSFAPRGAPSRWSPDSAYASGQSMPGESNEDLYFYKQQKVTLKKGDRARYTVFTNPVPYEHIYTWEVPDNATVDDRGYYRDSSSNDRSTEDKSEQVWHSLRLENTTSQPWTSAPAFTVNDSMPMAQDILKYAPPKAKTTLKLTLATDVRAEQVQIESSRKKADVDYFDQITVDGKLTIRNMKQNAIKISVKKQLTGDVLETNENGKATKTAKKLNSVNPNSEIQWEIDMAPGAEKTLTYKYNILMRR